MKKLLTIFLATTLSGVVLMAETYVGVPMGIKYGEITDEMSDPVLGLNKSFLFKDFKYGKDNYRFTSLQPDEVVLGLKLEGVIEFDSAQKIEERIEAKHTLVDARQRTEDIKARLIKDEAESLKEGIISKEEFARATNIKQAEDLTLNFDFSNGGDRIYMEIMMRTVEYGENPSVEKKEDELLTFVQIIYMDKQLVALQ